MNIRIFSLIAVGLILVASGCEKPVETINFHVEGMVCEEGCATSVAEILSKQPGVKSAKVDFEAETATCVVESGAFNSEKAIEDLVDQSFTATVVE